MLRSLVAGETEHHPLVSGALVAVEPLAFVNALGDISGLSVNGGKHRDIFVVEAHIGICIANLLDRLARHLVKITIALGGYLSRDQRQAGSNQGLDRHAGIGILAQQVIEDRIRDLV